MSYYKPYKHNPTFDYNYCRDSYIPPPVSTFQFPRSSRFFSYYIQKFSYPFSITYYHSMRFFGYQLVFQRYSLDSLFSPRESKLFYYFYSLILFMFTIHFTVSFVGFIELFDLFFIQVPLELLRRFLL